MVGQMKILDTKVYEVELTSNEVTVLMINLIAESMYAQCDISGYKYFIPDLFIDFRRSSKAASLSI